MKAKIWMAIKLMAVFVIASPLLLDLADRAVSQYNNKRIQEAVAKNLYEKDIAEERRAKYSSK